jgi:hypothetical protein
MANNFTRVYILGMLVMLPWSLRAQEFTSQPRIFTYSVSSKLNSGVRSLQLVERALRQVLDFAPKNFEWAPATSSVGDFHIELTTSATYEKQNLGNTLFEIAQLKTRLADQFLTKRFDSITSFDRTNSTSPIVIRILADHVLFDLIDGREARRADGMVRLMTVLARELFGNALYMKTDRKALSSIEFQSSSRMEQQAKTYSQIQAFRAGLDFWNRIVKSGTKIDEEMKPHIEAAQNREKRSLELTLDFQRRVRNKGEDVIDVPARACKEVIRPKS